MENGKLCILESNIEQIFIDQWITKLGIWSQGSPIENPLYNKDVLVTLGEKLKNYQFDDSVRVFISKSDISEHWASYRELEWEYREDIKLKVAAIIKPTDSDISYVLGRYLEAVPSARVNKAIDMCEWRSIQISPYVMNPDSEPFEEWIFVRLVKMEPNKFKAKNEKGEWI